MIGLDTDVDTLYDKKIDLNDLLVDLAYIVR
jgi:hypothetical protein